MRTRLRGMTGVAIIWLCCGAAGGWAQERKIAKEVLRDKIAGYWIGQLVGNYLGFPFENVYVEEPVPVLVDRYYTALDAGDLTINAGDARGYTRIVADMFEGAYSDDDTDIEFVTLHGVERFGLDIDYAQIAEMWRTHINRKIWVANRTARTLMDQGLIPPETGSQEHNSNWFQIDPQLVNEIWGAFYPGMTRRAGERSLWGARITNDSWGTHPTIAYGVMYSAAFFETDVRRLVRLARQAVPDDSPFAEGMDDVIRWHQQHPDWRDTRALIHEKYYRYEKDGRQAPVSVVSSLPNGLCGIMAILYGEGDFTRTAGIAVSAGYDCDNQAATCAGLIGVLHGGDAIPARFTKELPLHGKWDTPFNNRYLNYTRDGLPIDNRISDIVDRILRISEQAILDAGGRKIVEDGQEVYVVMVDFSSEE